MTQPTRPGSSSFTAPGVFGTATGVPARAGANGRRTRSAGFEPRNGYHERTLLRELARAAGELQRELERENYASTHCPLCTGVLQERRAGMWCQRCRGWLVEEQASYGGRLIYRLWQGKP